MQHRRVCPLRIISWPPAALLSQIVHFSMCRTVNYPQQQRFVGLTGRHSALPTDALQIGLQQRQQRMCVHSKLLHLEQSQVSHMHG